MRARGRGAIDEKLLAQEKHLLGNIGGKGGAFESKLLSGWTM